MTAELDDLEGKVNALLTKINETGMKAEYGVVLQDIFDLLKTCYGELSAVKQALEQHNRKPAAEVTEYKHYCNPGVLGVEVYHNSGRVNGAEVYVYCVENKISFCLRTGPKESLFSLGSKVEGYCQSKGKLPGGRYRVLVCWAGMTQEEYITLDFNTLARIILSREEKLIRAQE